MGAQGEKIKGVLPWLVRWACRSGTRYFCPASAALVSPVENKFFSRRTLFKLSPSKLAGSRAGSPISYCVSLVVNTTYVMYKMNFYLEHREV